MDMTYANREKPSVAPDLAAVKARQQGAWSSGDYAIVGEQLCEALDIHAGQKVLDVAAGNGKAALAALTDDVLALIGRFNRATDGAMVVPSDYLEIVVTQR